MNGRTMAVFVCAMLMIGTLAPAMAMGGEPKSTVKADPFLAAEWKLDEGTGITANDSSGNGNDGTLTNSPTWFGQGIEGTALRFDGSDDYVTVDSSPSVGISGNIKLEAWVRTTNIPSENHIIAGKHRLYESSGYFLEHETSGNFRFYISAIGGTMWVDSATAISDGEWHI